MNSKPAAKLILLLFVSNLLQCALVDSVAQPVASSTEKKITGKVTDENGSSLAGVSITLKGTNHGTSTDSLGFFTINVPEKDAVLLFSYLSYLPKEIKVGSSSTISVQLSPDPKFKDLGEVVVVGYGTQRKVDLTGAVGSVTRKDIANKPFTSPDQILGGRVPGVNITNRSGDPGAPIDVRIRGVGTTGTNQPLWVIDGVPIVQTTNITVNTGSSTETNPLAGINSNDIESIDVLKDASAAAIYGARAANGVIIVTTRRGKEGRTSLTYDGYYGRQYVPQNRRFDLLNVEQYIALQKELERDFSTFSGHPFIDWQDAVFQTGPFQSHNITITGGTQKATFNVGAGYLDNTGVELAQGFRRISLKVNSDINVGKYLKFGESVLISGVNRLTQSEDIQSGAWQSANNAPYYAIYNPYGPLGYNVESDSAHGEGATGYNVVFRADPQVSETRVKSRKILSSLYGEFEPISGLKYRITAGVDYNVGDGTFYWAEEDAGDFQRQSLLVQERPLETTTNLSQTLTYQKIFDKHEVTALIGYEETSFEFNKMRIQAAIIAAFYGGFGPALLVSILSALTIDYFFVPPFGALELTVGNSVRVGVFIIVSALVSWLNASRKQLMDEREKLVTKVSGFNDQLRKDVESATEELATANDVLFKTQQRLARSERLAVVGQIAASLAHEIGTPLNAISGHVELLAANHPNHADTQRRTRIIERQLGFIIGTVKRLLEWTHKKRVVFEPLDINALIGELLWLVSPTLEKNSVTVNLKQETELPLIEAHRDSLQQVFLNLINNSIDAMPSGGRIEIATRLNLTAGCAEIVFRDSGTGIGQDAAQHLFEPMWTNKPSGSGFGLAIAEEIMTDHGGEISVVEGENQGAAFCLTLPLAQAEVKADFEGMVISDVA